MTIILENKVPEKFTDYTLSFMEKLKLSKNVNNKKCAPKLIFFNEKKIERFGQFLMQKIDFESQKFAIFDNQLLNLYKKLAKRFVV